MNTDTNKFELKFNGEKLLVERHLISGQPIYRILFESKKMPLVLTRAESPNIKNWWTSIPEGRQKEAEDIGQLIEIFLKS